MEERYAELVVLIKKDSGEYTPADPLPATIDLYRVESFYGSPGGESTCVTMYSGDFFNVAMQYADFKKMYTAFADKKIQLFA